MKGILIYQPTSKSAPLADVIDGLDPRLREKILLRLYFLTQLEKPEMKEPHFKRFSIERYRDLWELRVKSKVLIRIIFCTLPNGDDLLLHGFVKRQKRDTMQALEQSTTAEYIGDVTHEGVESVTYVLTYIGTEANHKGVSAAQVGAFFADHFPWILGGIVLICAAVGGTLLVCRRKAVVKAECEADETEENEEDQEA